MRVRRQLRCHHVADLYDLIRSRKGHSIAIGAVSRHLAEASWVNRHPLGISSYWLGQRRYDSNETVSIAKNIIPAAMLYRRCADIRTTLVYPLAERLPTWIPKCADRGRDAATMLQVVIYRQSFFLRWEPLFASLGHTDLTQSDVLAMPFLQRIGRRVR